MSDIPDSTSFRKYIFQVLNEIKDSQDEIKKSIDDIKQQLDRQVNHSSSKEKNNSLSSSMINLNTHYLGTSGYDYKITYALMNACNSDKEYEACLSIIRRYAIEKKTCTVDYCFENWTKILKQAREQP